MSEQPTLETPYISNFDIGPIVTLSNQWVEMGNSMQAAGQACDLAITQLCTSGWWAGAGSTAALNAWSAYYDNVFLPVNTAVWQTGEMLLYYAMQVENLQESEAQGLAAYDQQQLTQLLDDVIGAIFNIAAVFGGELIDGFIRGLLTAAPDLAKFAVGALGSFAANTAIAVGTQLTADALSQYAIDQQFGQKFSWSWQAEFVGYDSVPGFINDALMGLGLAVEGGGFALEKISKPKLTVPLDDPGAGADPRLAGSGGPVPDLPPPEHVTLSAPDPGAGGLSKPGDLSITAGPGGGIFKGISDLVDAPPGGAVAHIGLGDGHVTTGPPPGPAEGALKEQPPPYERSPSYEQPPSGGADPAPRAGDPPPDVSARVATPAGGDPADVSARIGAAHGGDLAADVSVRVAAGGSATDVGSAVAHDRVPAGGDHVPAGGGGDQVPAGGEPSRTAPAGQEQPPEPKARATRGAQAEPPWVEAKRPAAAADFGKVLDTTPGLRDKFDALPEQGRIDVFNQFKNEANALFEHSGLARGGEGSAAARSAEAKWNLDYAKLKATIKGKVDFSAEAAKRTERAEQALKDTFGPDLDNPAKVNVQLAASWFRLGVRRDIERYLGDLQGGGRPDERKFDDSFGKRKAALFTQRNRFSLMTEAIGKAVGDLRVKLGDSDLPPNEQDKWAQELHDGLTSWRDRHVTADLHQHFDKTRQEWDAVTKEALDRADARLRLLGPADEHIAAFHEGIDDGLDKYSAGLPRGTKLGDGYREHVHDSLNDYASAQLAKLRGDLVGGQQPGRREDFSSALKSVADSLPNRLTIERTIEDARARLGQQVTDALGKDQDPNLHSALASRVNRQLDIKAGPIKEQLAKGGFRPAGMKKALSGLRHETDKITSTLPAALGKLKDNPPAAAPGPDARAVSWDIAKEEADARLQHALEQEKDFQSRFNPERDRLVTKFEGSYPDIARSPELASLEDGMRTLHGSLYGRGDGLAPQLVWGKGLAVREGNLEKLLSGRTELDTWLGRQETRFNDVLDGIGKPAGEPADSGGLPGAEKDVHGWEVRLTPERRNELWADFSANLRDIYTGNLLAGPEGLRHDALNATVDDVFAQLTARQRNLQAAYDGFTKALDAFLREHPAAAGEAGPEAGLSNDGIGRVWDDVRRDVTGLTDAGTLHIDDPVRQQEFNALDPNDRQQAGLSHIIASLGSRLDGELSYEANRARYLASFGAEYEQFRHGGESPSWQAKYGAATEFLDKVRQAHLGKGGQTAADLLAEVPGRIEFLNGADKALKVAARTFHTASADFAAIPRDRLIKIGEDYREDIGRRYTETFDHAGGDPAGWLRIEKSAADTFGATVRQLTETMSPGHGLLDPGHGLPDPASTDLAHGVTPSVTHDITNAGAGKPDILAGERGERGAGGAGRASGVGDWPPEAPAGAKGLFDGSGRLQHVMTEDGTYTRRPDGTWSPLRTEPGALVIRTIGGKDEPLTLTVNGEPIGVHEVVHEGEHQVAARQLADPDGNMLTRPRLFMNGDKGWTETPHPDPASYEAWLAGENGASGAARAYLDIAARPGFDVQTLRRLPDEAFNDLVQNLLKGTDGDKTAAAYAIVARGAPGYSGKVLRWTQQHAADALSAGRIVNMAAGEGKSLMFLVNAVRQAVRPDVDVVHVITSRDPLAKEELDRYTALLKLADITVHRMNPWRPPPPAVAGHPTIYVGTPDDVAFTKLTTGLLPGQADAAHLPRTYASLDEIDDVLVYSQTSYFLSKGTGHAAPEAVAATVRWANSAVARLTVDDFARDPGPGRGFTLTPEGKAKAEQLLGGLTDEQVSRLNLAGTARFGYVKGRHYEVDDGTGKVIIIKDGSHGLLYNPETASESRWNGGLAQAIEAKENLPVRADPVSSDSLTAKELFSGKFYAKVTGASGTAKGKGDLYAKQGLAADIAEIPRYYALKLTISEHVSTDLNAKVTAIARDTADMQKSDTPRPQLILAHENDLVPKVAAEFDAHGVDYVMFDAKRLIGEGAGREKAFKDAVDAAGAEGKVLLTNMQGARGVDIPLSDLARSLGGLHVRVTAHSGFEDIDIQAQNRAGRSGDDGSVTYYTSLDDEALNHTQNPDVEAAVARYAQARADHLSGGTDVTRAALKVAEGDLIQAVRDVQAENAYGLTHGPVFLPGVSPQAAYQQAEQAAARYAQAVRNGFAGPTATTLAHRYATAFVQKDDGQAAYWGGKIRGGPLTEISAAIASARGTALILRTHLETAQAGLGADGKAALQHEITSAESHVSALEAELGELRARPLPRPAHEAEPPLGGTPLTASDLGWLRDQPGYHALLAAAGMLRAAPAAQADLLWGHLRYTPQAAGRPSLKNAGPAGLPGRSPGPAGRRDAAPADGPQAAAPALAVAIGAETEHLTAAGVLAPADAGHEFTEREITAAWRAYYARLAAGEKRPETEKASPRSAHPDAAQAALALKQVSERLELATWQLRQQLAAEVSSEVNELIPRQIAQNALLGRRIEQVSRSLAESLADTVLADTVLADTVLADTGVADTVLADTGAADTAWPGWLAAQFAAGPDGPLSAFALLRGPLGKHLGDNRARLRALPGSAERAQALKTLLDAFHKETRRQLYTQLASKRSLLAQLPEAAGPPSGQAIDTRADLLRLAWLENYLESVLSGHRPVPEPGSAAGTRGGPATARLRPHPAWAQTAWGRVLSQHELPVPDGFELTVVPGGFVAHPAGTAVDPQLRAALDDAVPDRAAITLAVHGDDGEPGPGSVRARLNAYLEQLPAAARWLIESFTTPDAASAVRQEIPRGLVPLYTERYQEPLLTVNTGYWPGADDYARNCVPVAIMTDALLSGQPAQGPAPTTWQQPIRALEEAAGDAFRQVAGWDEIAGLLAAAGHGARAYVAYKQPGAAYYHVLNAVYDADFKAGGHLDGVLFLDGQTGTLASLPAAPAYLGVVLTAGDRAAAAGHPAAGRPASSIAGELAGVNQPGPAQAFTPAPLPVPAPAPAPAPAARPAVDPVRAARHRVLAVSRVLAATGDQVLPVVPGPDPNALRAALRATLARLETVVAAAATVGEIERAERDLVRHFAGLERFREVLPQGAQNPAVTGRPAWYEDLTRQVSKVGARLEALPFTARPMPGAGMVRTMPQAREQLAAGLAEFLHAYLVAAALQAAGAGGGAGYIGNADPLGGSGAPPAPGEAAQRLRAARERLYRLLDDIEGEVLRAGDAPADQARELPPMGSPQDLLPARSSFQEPFDPPPHLADPDNPVTGAGDTVTDISDALIAAIRHWAWLALPEAARTDGNRAVIAAKTTREELLEHAAALVSDQYSVEVAGQLIAVRVRLARGRQVSNAVATRLKQTLNSRGTAGHDRSHGKFADVNVNLAYSNDLVRGGWPLQMTGTEGYFGLLTILLAEHSETAWTRNTVIREETIKSSSYIGYVFSYQARVEVSADPQAGRPRPAGGAGNAAPAWISDGVRVLSSRETLVPRNRAAGRASKAVHAARPGQAELIIPPAAAEPPAVRLPGHYAIEAFNAAGQLRELIEQHVSDLAPPGSAERRRLGARLTPQALAEQIGEATDSGGSQIVFGENGADAPVSVTWWLDLIPEEVTVLADDGTWMDIDQREVRGQGRSVGSADAIDIPPGLMLWAVPVNFLRLDWVEPFAYFWPTLDAEQVRSGPGLATTKTAGIRYTGERTAVTRFRPRLRIARSDQPGQVTPSRQLDAPLFVRSLRKDVARWAALPRMDDDPGGPGRPLPYGQLRAPENFEAYLGSLIQPTDLTGADGLYAAAEQVLLRGHPEFLPSPGGSERAAEHMPGSWVTANQFAVANQRRLKKGLSQDMLLANLRQAATGEGYTIVLHKGAPLQPSGTAVVRVRARFGRFDAAGDWITEPPAWSQWLPDSELDVNVTEEQDTLLTHVKVAGLLGGVQTVIGVGEAAAGFAGGLLDGVEVRPMYHQRLIKTAGVTAGLASWGLHGYSLDDLAEFGGAVTFFLSVETADGDGPGRRQDHPLLPGDVIAGYDPDNAIALQPAAPRPALGPFDSAHADRTDWQPQPAHHAHHVVPLAGPAPRYHRVDSFAPGHWLPGREWAVPVQAGYKIVVPVDLTSKPVADATGALAWVPYGTGKTVNGQDRGLPPVPLEFTATAAHPFPAHLFVETSGDGLVRQILSDFAAAGARHVEVSARQQIETAVSAALAATPTLRAATEPAEIWAGEIGPASGIDGALTSHKLMGKVELRMEVNRARTIAVPTSYGTYNDVGAVSATGVIDEVTGWLPDGDGSFYAGVRLRFPLKLGADYPNEAPPENYDPPGNAPYTFTLQPQYGYRREKTRGTALDQAGSDGRGALAVGPTVVTVVEATYYLRVTTWHTRLGVSWGTAVAQSPVPASGYSVLSDLDATRLGLMPAWGRVELDRSVPYRLPEWSQATLRGESIVTPPDAGGFVARLLAAIRARWGQEVEKAAAQEVGKILGPYNTAAFLRLMANGGLDIDVPVTEHYHIPVPLTGTHLPGPPVNRDVTIKIRARLGNPAFEGVVRQLHRLSSRAGEESTAEESASRVSRHLVDPVRFWQIWQLPQSSSPFAALWHNLNLTLFGQSQRKLAHARTQEKATGGVTDTGAGGPAQFRRDVWFSAEVIVDSAPTAMLDGITLGALQDTETLMVGEDPVADSSVVTRHDTWLLDQESHPKAELPPPPPARPRPAQPPGAAPAFELDLPQIDKQPLRAGQDLADTREGLDLAAAARQEPGMLRDVLVRWPGELTSLRGKLARLLTPEAQRYLTTWRQVREGAARTADAFWTAVALAANYLLAPPPGPSPFNPRALVSRQAASIVSEPFLTPRLPKILSAATSVRVRLPGRLWWPLGQVDIAADVLAVHEVKDTRGVMIKDFQASADTVTAGNDVLFGTYLGNWVQPAFQTPGQPYDYSNVTGPLLGHDHIETSSASGLDRTRNAREAGTKRTWVDYTRLVVDVRYRMAFSPYGVFSRRSYFADNEVQRVEIMVPTRYKDRWLSLQPRAAAPAGPAARAAEAARGLAAAARELLPYAGGPGAGLAVRLDHALDDLRAALAAPAPGAVPPAGTPPQVTAAAQAVEAVVRDIFAAAVNVLTQQHAALAEIESAVRTLLRHTGPAGRWHTAFDAALAAVPRALPALAGPPTVAQLELAHWQVLGFDIAVRALETAVLDLLNAVTPAWNSWLEEITDLTAGARLLLSNAGPRVGVATSLDAAEQAAAAAQATARAVLPGAAPTTLAEANALAQGVNLVAAGLEALHAAATETVTAPGVPVNLVQALAADWTASEQASMQDTYRQTQEALRDLHVADRLRVELDSELVTSVRAVREQAERLENNRAMPPRGLPAPFSPQDAAALVSFGARLHLAMQGLHRLTETVRDLRGAQDVIAVINGQRPQLEQWFGDATAALRQRLRSEQEIRGSAPGPSAQAADWSLALLQQERAAFLSTVGGTLAALPPTASPRSRDEMRQVIDAREPVSQAAGRFEHAFGRALAELLSSLDGHFDDRANLIDSQIAVLQDLGADGEQARAELEAHLGAARADPALSPGPSLAGRPAVAAIAAVTGVLDRLDAQISEVVAQYTPAVTDLAGSSQAGPGTMAAQRLSPAQLGAFTRQYLPVLEQMRTGPVIAQRPPRSGQPVPLAGPRRPEALDCVAGAMIFDLWRHTGELSPLPVTENAREVGDLVAWAARKRTFVRGYQQVWQIVADAGERASGFVVWKVRGQEHSHVLNVIRDRELGGALLLDFQQPGGLAVLPDEAELDHLSVIMTGGALLEPPDPAYVTVHRAAEPGADGETAAEDQPVTRLSSLLPGHGYPAEQAAALPPLVEAFHAAVEAIDTAVDGPVLQIIDEGQAGTGPAGPAGPPLAGHSGALTADGGAPSADADAVGCLLQQLTAALRGLPQHVLSELRGALLRTTAAAHGTRSRSHAADLPVITWDEGGQTKTVSGAVNVRPARAAGGTALRMAATVTLTSVPSSYIGSARSLVESRQEHTATVMIAAAPDPSAISNFTSN
jgi:hypothetical protein